MRNANQQPQMHGHHQRGPAQPMQRVAQPLRVQQQQQRAHVNLPPPVRMHQHPPPNPGGQIPRRVEGVRRNQNVNHVAAGVGA